MSRSLYAVYGAGGHGRETMPLARVQAALQGIPADRIVFVDDHRQAGTLNDHRVLAYDEFLAENADQRFAVLAMADSRIRETLAARCEHDGIHAWSVQASNVVILDDVVIGAGAILSPFVTVTSNIRIGRQFHANYYGYIAHDCVIGDFVTFAPGVQCNGNVVIHDHAYIGAGAVIRQGSADRPLTIGRGAVIGMGAIVTKDVPAETTVVGNPARPLVKAS